jgi:hypothetical protein
MMMIKPPASGMHARHRVLGTPGPTGWNDHGEPCQWRQQGPTPGPLSVNDHGTPLPGNPALLPSERREEIATRINQLIAQADASPNAQTAQKLRTCLAAVKNHDATDRAPDETSRGAEAYFNARLLALEGKTGLTRDADQTGLSSGEALKMGAVEYRTMGSFFQPAASGRSAIATTELSYQRIGQCPPAHDTRLAAPHSASDWIERGIADGLRDRADLPSKLRRYAAAV